MQQSREVVSTRVVEAIARWKGTDPTALPPLHEVVDPEAIDALYAPYANGDCEGSDPPTVLFSFADCDVVVRSSTEIEIS